MLQPIAYAQPVAYVAYVQLQPAPCIRSPEHLQQPVQAPPPQVLRRQLQPLPPRIVTGQPPCLWNAPPGALQKRFERLVMCNFEPRHPSQLPLGRWASLHSLADIFGKHVQPGEVPMKGPGNLKQRITAW